MVDLPAPDRPVNHSSRGLLVLERGMGVAVDVDRLPMDVLARRSAKWSMPAATVALADLVDQDEAAQIARFSA